MLPADQVLALLASCTVALTLHYRRIKLRSSVILVRQRLLPLHPTDLSCRLREGGARYRRIAARMERTIVLVTATSTNWNVMERVWRTTWVPILICLGWRQVGDQSAMASAQEGGQALGQRLQLQPHLVFAEPLARQPCPAECLLFFLDVLLCRSVLIVRQMLPFRWYRPDSQVRRRPTR